MNSNKIIKVLAIIVLILQSITGLASFGIIIMQKAVIPVFSRMSLETVKIVVPPSFVFIFLQLFIYIIFYFSIKKDNNNPLVILLVIISILFSIFVVIASVIGNMYYARLGQELLAVSSSVTTMLSYVNTLFGIPALALFYVTCGQYLAQRN